MLAVNGLAYAAPQVVLNGQTLDFDVPPLIENDRTLVPLRAIFEALGAGVQWDGATQTITSIKGNTVIKLIVDGQAYINGQPVNLDVPTKIIDDRIMVPLRFVSQALGCQVEWDKTIQTITITSVPSLEESTGKIEDHSLDVDQADDRQVEKNNITTEKTPTVTTPATSITNVPGVSDQQNTISGNLVAYYPFDGDFKDYSGNNNNGTPKGDIKFVNGIIGKGAYFTKNHYIEVDDSDSLNLTTSFTFSAWVYEEKKGDGDYAPIFCKGNDHKNAVTSPYAFCHSSNGIRITPVVKLANATDTSVRTFKFKDPLDNLFGQSTPSIGNPENKPVRFNLETITWDGENIKFYVNGSLRGTIIERIGKLGKSAGKLFIATDPPGVQEYFNGIIDDLRIYNKALTDREVKELYGVILQN